MGTQTHGLHRKWGSAGPVIYLCRIPLCCFPQLHFQLFVLKCRIEQDKQSQRPSPPFLSDSRHRLERWWLGRKTDPPSSPGPALRQAGTVRSSPGRPHHPAGSRGSTGAPHARPQLPWPCHPLCRVREPGLWVPLSLSSLFHPRAGVWKVLSSALQPHLQGVLPQRWQPGLHGADAPSPAFGPVAGWVKSLSFIPELHHGCNSVDLSASPLCDFVSTKRRDARILWVCAFKNKLCFFFF